MDDNVSRAELTAAMATHELEVEKRAGKIEARLTALEVQLEAMASKYATLLSRGDITEMVRGVVADEGRDDRSTREYLMKAVMFLISIGTLVFAAKGAH